MRKYLAHPLLPEIITLGIIVTGALCFPLLSSGLHYAPPFLFSSLRVFIAGIGILLILPLLGQPILPPKDPWKWVMLFSIAAVVFGYGGMFLSHAGNSSMLVPVLENLQPFLTIMLATAFLHEKLSSATRTVLAFGTFGIFFMSAGMFTGSGDFNFQGGMLAFLAALSASGASILAKRIKRPDVILTITAWQFIVGSIPLFILSRIFETSLSTEFNISFLAILFFLAIIGTAATSAVWYVLVQTVDVSRLSVFFFLSPAFGLLLANRLYAVPIGFFEWIGITTIIVGVIFGFKKQSARESESLPINKASSINNFSFYERGTRGRNPK